MNKQSRLTSVRAWMISAYWVVGFAILLAFCAAPAAAQSASSGTVSGQVTDPQGAALVGAEVVMTDPTTNITRTVVLRKN
jgi:hypothetical protein